MRLTQSAFLPNVGRELGEMQTGVDAARLMERLTSEVTVSWLLHGMALSFNFVFAPMTLSYLYCSASHTHGTKYTSAAARIVGGL